MCGLARSLSFCRARGIHPALHIVGRGWGCRWNPARAAPFTALPWPCSQGHGDGEPKKKDFVACLPGKSLLATTTGSDVKGLCVACQQEGSSWDREWHGRGGCAVGMRQERRSGAKVHHMLIPSPCPEQLWRQDSELGSNPGDRSCLSRSARKPLPMVMSSSPPPTKQI